MPRIRQADRRRHLMILIIALVLALVILIIQAETASAVAPSSPVGGADAGQVHQVDNSDELQIVTTERVLLLGMLGLVGLTWLYLRLRPSPRVDREPDQDQRPEHK